MPLAPLAVAPKIINLPLTAAGVAPTLCRVAPFRHGNEVVALSAGAAALRGACFDRATAKKSVRLIAPAAAISAAAGTVGFAATWSGNKITAPLVITLGNAAGNIIDSIPDHTTAADADTAIAVVVLVNGVPFGRIADAASVSTAAGQWGMDNDTADNYNVTIFADATNFIPVGAEIEILLTNKIGALAQRNATTGALEAGGALTAGVAVQRRLGVVETVVDTAGRSTVALASSDVIMSEVAACSLLSQTL
jgi:hypothetical protein